MTLVTFLKSIFSVTEGHCHIAIFAISSHNSFKFIHINPSNIFSARTAESGKAAIRRSNADLSGVALIDFRLPGLEGTELLTAFRETTPKMVKIMIIGYPTLQNAIECLNKHADAYFAKPVDYDSLLNTIRTLIQKQQDKKHACAVTQRASSRFNCAGTTRALYTNLNQVKKISEKR